MLNTLKDLRNQNSEEGFTLIELMIVVVIIGILAAIAIPIFANQQKSAIAAGVKSDVKNTNTQIVTALVKSPTASDVAVLVGATSGTAVTNADALTNSLISISDENTTITIQGTWDAYTVTGANTSVGTDADFVYDSETGKF